MLALFEFGPALQGEALASSSHELTRSLAGSIVESFQVASRSGALGLAFVTEWQRMSIRFASTGFDVNERLLRALSDLGEEGTPRLATWGEKMRIPQHG